MKIIISKTAFPFLPLRAAEIRTARISSSEKIKKGEVKIPVFFEGVGKSTNLAFIRALLEEHGAEVIVTREPGGTPLGEEIRELLLDHRHDGMSADTASRTQSRNNRAPSSPRNFRFTCKRSDHFLAQ